MISEVMIAARSQAKTVNAAAILLALYIGVVAYGSSLGRIEGKYAPVVGNVSITSAKPAGGGTEITGTAKKLRACDFLYIDWYLENGNRRSLASVNYLEEAKVRTVGDFEFGPWLVNIPPHELKSQSFADVVHYCHPLYNTVTRFYGAKNR